MSKTTKLIVAYVAGQVTQIVIHAMCLNNNMYAYKQIPFCVAAGFVILFAVISGTVIASKDDAGKREKKSYLDYAKVPEEEDIDEVVRLFDGPDKN